MTYKKASDVRKENAILKAKLAADENLLENDPGFVFSIVAELVKGDWKLRNEYCNHTMMEALGFTRERINASKYGFFKEILHEDDYPNLHQSLWNLCCEENIGLQLELVCRCKDKDGNYNWVIGKCWVVSHIKGKTQWEICCNVTPVTKETLKDPKMRYLVKDYKKLICEQNQAKLTTRELEILKLLAIGTSIKLIESALGITENTIKKHKYNMIHKLGLTNTPALILWANECGVV